MMALSAHVRVLVCVVAIDFRKGIDGLAALCRQKLQCEPLDGALFVFSSRRRTSLKILVYDGQGFWLCQKRLSQGRFGWWPQDSAQAATRLEAHQLQWLLWNGDPTSAKTAPLWRPIGQAA